MSITTDSRILVVGAGCFGLSTAYHLLKRGFRDVLILDRSPTLPAPDAASTDLNKIVRSSYSDIFYARLAREAIKAWKDREEWGDTYHECGVAVVGGAKASYTDNSFRNDIQLGARTEALDDPESIRSLFPPGVKTGSFTSISGYVNRDGGWAFAAQGITLMLEKVKSLGGKVVAGVTVTGLTQRDGKTTGVRCADGSEYDVDLVVVASGSWTASTFQTLDLEGSCLATGQSVAFIQLTPEEGDRYRDCPVYLDFGSGFYVFPPNKDNIVKMAIHASGHTFKDPSIGVAVSSPRTSVSHGDDGLRIPKSLAQTIRSHLHVVYPELAEKPFGGTRLCWYTDTPDDDWVIGYHPSDTGLVFATGGSGHAYKFLPNIGQLVADAIQHQLDPNLVKRFALNREHDQHHVSRTGPKAQELDITALVTPEDLLP